jgi:hypothetical protein
MVAPGATVPPEAGVAVTVTFKGGVVLADELLGTNGSSQAPTANSAGTMSIAPRRVDFARFAITTLPPRRQPVGPAGTGNLGVAGHVAH